MRPQKYSDEFGAAPMRRTPLPTAIGPDAAVLDTCTPLTNRRTVAPSYVRARFVPALDGIADGAVTMRSRLVRIDPTGRPLLLFAENSAYEEPRLRSL